MKMRCIALCALLFLAGCEAESDGEDLRLFVAALRSDGAGAAGVIEDASVAALPTGPRPRFRYGASSLHDPFRRRAPDVGPNHGASLPASPPDPGRLRQHLEHQALADLILVGFVRIGGGAAALVQAPGGGIFPVRVGDYLGEDHGLVLGVDARGVDLRESVQVGATEWRYRLRRLMLPP